MAPKSEIRVHELPVSPLCDIEVPIHKWESRKFGGNQNIADGGSKFIAYIKSKNPGLPPNGWRDITPYFGKVWPKSISAWRTSAGKQGYYISITTITKGDVKYRAILVCIKPA